MLVVLNVCHHDRDQALRMLKWIGELGGCKNHTLILSFNQTLFRQGGQHDLYDEAVKHFLAVETFVPFDEDERGWPQSPNHAWRNIVQHIRLKVQQPWLWLEPDCVPLVPDWLDRIEAEYLAEKKPFMGMQVTEPASRLSGVAVYPPKVVAFTRRMPELDSVAWDQLFAQDFLPHAHTTRLIQHLWCVSRDPVVPPTFPDASSLAALWPEAVLFHRVKDYSLIDRIREKRGSILTSIVPTPEEIFRKLTRPNPEEATKESPKTWIGDIRFHVKAISGMVDTHSRKQTFHNELRKAGLLGRINKKHE